MSAHSRSDHWHAILVTVALVAAMGILVLVGYDLKQAAVNYTDAAIEGAQEVSREFKRSLREIQETPEPKK